MSYFWSAFLDGIAAPLMLFRTASPEKYYAYIPGPADAFAEVMGRENIWNTPASDNPDDRVDRRGQSPDTSP